MMENIGGRALHRRITGPYTKDYYPFVDGNHFGSIFANFERNTILLAKEIILTVPDFYFNDFVGLDCFCADFRYYHLPIP